MSNTTRDDPLRRMTSYVLAQTLLKTAWDDATALSRHAVTCHVSGQLYRAIGSIAANIAEGYSRSSGRDRVRLLEYALGSARESIVWFELSRPVLGAVADERIKSLERIRALLLATIPRDRERLVRPDAKNPARGGAFR